MTNAERCKEWRKKNPGYSRRVYLANPIRVRARERLKEAVRRGNLTKPTKCQRCNENTPKLLLQGHHRDYFRPLDVTWLCRPCHRKSETGS